MIIFGNRENPCETFGRTFKQKLFDPCQFKLSAEWSKQNVLQVKADDFKQNISLVQGKCSKCRRLAKLLLEEKNSIRKIGNISES